MVQERAGPGTDEYPLTVPQDPQKIEGSQGRPGLAQGGAEGGEVMVSLQSLCRLVHRLDIKRAGHPPDATAVEDGRRTPVQDGICVAAPGGIEPGVKAGQGDHCVKNANRKRFEVEVEGVAHGVGRGVLVQIEMSHLTRGMNARVRPSGAVNRRRFASEMENGRFQGLLLIKISCDTPLVLSYQVVGFCFADRNQHQRGE